VRRRDHVSRLTTKYVPKTQGNYTIRIVIPAKKYTRTRAENFQARACNTMAFRAVARWATHRPRVRRPAPWPRARTGARTATLQGGADTPPRSAPARNGRGGRHGARAGGWGRPPRDGAPLTVLVDVVSNRRRAAATEAGAQARSPAGHRGRFEPRQTPRAVPARNSGRWGGAVGQPPPGPCDPCGRTVLLSHVTLFAFSVIATLTRPQIPEDMNADCHL